ncbi:probable RNA polymerase sigma-E factor [Blastopirellula marina DSM 3645]|uniref:Probable RNA polymerase sigma-E factor n=2 Tax=Blastopirellula marina TaxID=124 RepID=A4A0B9_9BACT|nr:probable RNA polymerase sigma-E factor [Blastopirellula marina DSM 3645]
MEHQDRLLRYILPLVGSKDDAEDILQETATAIWKKFDQFDTTQPFVPWAKKFAHNEILRHHRNKKSVTFLTEELVEDLASRYDQREELRICRYEALMECMEKLPDGDRQILDIRYRNPQATIQSLANEVEQSANVLYKSLARMRRQLFNCVNRKLERLETT